MSMTLYDRLAARLAPLGLAVRGGFRADADDGLAPVASVVMIGHLGRALWPVFEPEAPGGPDPLDTWVRARLTPIAADFRATVAMPSDGPPYRPFQRWAMRADAVHPSPLGLLIHPQYGLWHAYRAALLFAEPLDLPPRAETAAPCGTCAERPCLSACPVGAFTGTGYDAAGCRDHVRSPAGEACRTGGCLARHACPVGRAHAYGADQQAFHMAAFLG